MAACFAVGATLAAKCLNQSIIPKVLWIMLQIQSLPRCLQKVRHQAYPHQALHAPDQRQGRTLHPDNVARMGLRNRIPELTPAKSRLAEMAAPLQLASTPCQSQSTNPNQPTRPGSGQPLEASQLALNAGRRLRAPVRDRYRAPSWHGRRRRRYVTRPAATPCGDPRRWKPGCTNRSVRG